MKRIKENQNSANELLNNERLSEIENQEVVKLVKELLTYAKPKDFIESANNGHLANIEAQMKEFKLNGSEVAGMSFLNQGLTGFFYKLDELHSRLKIYREINSIEEI